MQVEAVHGRPSRLSSNQGRRGCEEKRDKSERAGHAGIRDTRGLLPLLCPKVNEMAEFDVYQRSGAQSNGQHAYLYVAKVGRLELEHEVYSLCWQLRR